MKPLPRPSAVAAKVTYLASTRARRRRAQVEQVRVTPVGKQRRPRA